MRHLLLSISVVIGCSQDQLYSECPPPDEHLQLMFKPAIDGNPFSHSFCIVCHPDLEPEEYADWAIEMGAPEGPSSTDDVYPCLYAYSDGTDIDSMATCESLVCDGNAVYNDMVAKDNGNVILDTILN